MEVEKTEFKSREEYKKFLKEKLESISENEEYNIFLHIITVFGSDYLWRGKTFEDALDDKTEGILKSGVSLNGRSKKYTAIGGTARFVGNSQNLDLDQIVDYVYDQGHFHLRRVVTLAIPKYIKINGFEQEFSSYKGVGADFPTDKQDEQAYQELCDEYKKCNVNYNDNHHAKTSILDCILKNNIPKEFTLGIQEIDEEKDHYAFIENEKHISKMNEETRERYDAACAEKIEELGIDQEKDNRLQIFISESKKNMDAELEYDNSFDFD